MKSNTKPPTPKLQSVHPDPDWVAAPIDINGRFVNTYEPFLFDYKKLIKWQIFSTNPQREQKKQDKRRLRSIPNPKLFTSTEDTIVWLGHASFLIRLGGKTLLTDPIFFESLFLYRHVPLPFDPQDLANIDYILLSHDHRDHCDEQTLKFIRAKCPDVEILTGLEMGGLLEKWLPDTRIQQAGWYQKYALNEAFEIVFVPSRHWGKRGLWDERIRLWGGFFIRSRERTIYFMSDSGYGKHFKEIRQVCGSPDYALMGIGAYKPEWFMHSSHISPADAVKAFRDLGGRSFIPMHYGTFDLSDEPLLEPIDVLKQQPFDGLVELEVGEVLPLKEVPHHSPATAKRPGLPAG